MGRWVPAVLLIVSNAVSVAATMAQAASASHGSDKEIILPKGVPGKVARVLKHIDETGQAPEGYVGGRNFGNFEQRLPRQDRKGKLIKYQEWDVNRKVPGKNRGTQRLITGSDGSAYYTGNHYKNFIQIR